MSIFETDLPPKIKIEFVSNNHHRDEISVGIFLDFFEPILNSQKALPVSDIIDNKDSLNSLNILTGYGFISLLAGCVPHLLSREPYIRVELIFFRILY